MLFHFLTLLSWLLSNKVLLLVGHSEFNFATKVTKSTTTLHDLNANVGVHKGHPIFFRFWRYLPTSAYLTMSYALGIYQLST